MMKGKKCERQVISRSVFCFFLYFFFGAKIKMPPVEYTIWGRYLFANRLYQVQNDTPANRTIACKFSMSVVLFVCDAMNPIDFDKRP